MLGYQDLLILLGIGIFVFGAKKLPELARSLGQSMKEFKKAVAGQGEEESPKPESPTTTASATPSRACASCKTPLQPEWTHCPRCGAAASQSSTPTS